MFNIQNSRFLLEILHFFLPMQVSYNIDVLFFLFCVALKFEMILQNKNFADAGPPSPTGLIIPPFEWKLHHQPN